MRRLPIAACTLTTLALVLAGCSSGSESEPESSTATHLSGMQQYESIDDLAGDLRNGGMDCTPSIDSNQRFATQAGRCFVDGLELVLGIYAQESQISEQKAFTNDFSRMLGQPSYLVIGANWTVNCSSDQQCGTRVQSAIGGQVWESSTR